MADALPRIERVSAAVLAAVLAALAMYGVASTPGLVARWGGSPAGLALLLAWAPAAAWAAALAVRTPARAEWIGFALVALGFRLAALRLEAGLVSPGDPHWYLELARHLIAGEGLWIDDPAMGARVRAEFPPLYPLLLAGWGRLAGLSPLAVLASSVPVDLAAAALLARLGARFGSARAGLAAGALYLIWPATLLDAPLAQKEGVELVLALALANGWIAAATGARRGAGAAVGVGLPAGLLALTQPGLIPLAALIGLACGLRMGVRRFAAVAAGGLVVAAAVMLPWWWRNWAVFGAFVPLTSVGGLSLWIGENPAASGNWMAYPPALAGLSELPFARAAGRIAVDWMVHHPADVLRLNAAKFVRALGVGQFPLVRLAAMRPPPSPAVLAALLLLAQGTHVLLLGAGAASLAGRRRPAMLTGLLLALMVQFAAVGVWFEFGERHRQVLTPLLLLSVTVALARFRPRTVPAAVFWARRAA